MSNVILLLVPIIAAGTTAVFILLLRPVFARYLVVQPNSRSSHRNPTPQGGGIAVTGATILVALGTNCIVFRSFSQDSTLLLVFAATILIAVVGAIDDIRAIAVPPRLLLQALFVLVVLATLPADVRLLPVLPWWVERAVLLLGYLWFVNLVNFMDGIDWMTVAGIVPLAAATAVLGVAGALPLLSVIVALALLGALLGFAPFNRPVARLFLGDVGSLPIGLLTGWLLLQLAAAGFLAAALLLPLYYLADGTITLLRRVLNGEPFWRAHRGHFYQRALDAGLTVPEVISRVFATNIALAFLAIASVLTSIRFFSWIALAIGVLIVALLIAGLARGKR